MTIRSSIAKSIGQLTRWGLMTFTRGGSSLPGKIATTIDPDILSSLADDYDVIIITGTNGKTMTTALTVHALKQKYDYVLTNPTGSNMQQGIVSTFLASPKLPKGQRGVAVLEVDEGSLKHVVKHLQPQLYVHTNIFRDQMDRYGEIYSIYKLMTDAAKMTPTATILANGDSPLFQSTELPNPTKYFGFDHEEPLDVMPHYNTDGILCPHCHHILNYKLLTYANLGHYYCQHCGFERPELDFKITQIDDLNLTESSFTIENTKLTIPVAGLYNIYNALAAFSVARLFDVNPEAIVTGFKQAERVFGRQEFFEINEKKVLLNLVKNPVGLNQVIDLIGLSDEKFTLIAILNNRYADGTDVSWIWDGNYEQLASYPIKESYTSGMKTTEMTLRLKVAGIDPASIHEVNEDDIIKTIENSQTDYVHILATYTAMLDIRSKLIDKGYLK